MKKFITGLLAGAILTSSIALAATFTAEQAGFKILLNGNEFTPENPAVVIDGRTYLPLRAIGEALGVPVEWNNELRQVEIGTPQQATYGIGETWTVDGQWTLTINSVTEMKERNQYSDKTPTAVYLIDYTYTNIGYADLDGLYISPDEGIVDNAGVMGYTYPNSVTNSPKRTPVGATCNAQTCIGVDNAGDFQIHFSKYDNNSNKLRVVFDLKVQ